MEKMSNATKARGEEVEFNKIIETLPKEEQWRDEFDLYEYQGFWYPRKFLMGLMFVQEKFKAQPTDTVLCSFPKTGTTWMKALSFAVATRNRYGYDSDYSHHPLLSCVPHNCIPFLEVDLVPEGDDDGTGSYKRDPQLPLLSTHVPYTSLPKSIVETPGCKIVYVWRDPKDTFVSLWYFRKKIFEKKERKREHCFDTEFDRFCQGKSFYGPFWDHVLGFWNASLECPDKVLFLKYEDMKKDTLPYIRKLAEFLNQPFSEKEENEGVPQKIMELCGFQNLSSLEVNKTGKLRARAGSGFGTDNSFFFRKGEVGDWKTHLTMDMVERIDAITLQKFGGSGLI